MEQDLDAAVEFGPFRLLPTRRLLMREGVPVHLGDRALEILLILVELAPNVVSKKTLLERAWQSRFVEEVNLRFQIRALRKALGDGNRYISTVSGRGYCFVAPVVRSGEAVQRPDSAETNLPQPLTNIVARANELAELRETLEHGRLVTVVGPGGVGKTRLAVELGWRVLGSFPGGVWLIDLAPLINPDTLVSATAAVLGVFVPNPDKGVEAIALAIAARPTLLIFDNCEHLIAAAAQLVRGLIEKAPALSVLATSQEALGLQAEIRYRLPPLAAPPAGASEIAGFGAVDLFVRRAQTADRLFALDARNRADVAEICRRLDGLPLALEMAAVRLHLLGADGLRAGLDERLKLLKGAPHGGEMRHGSLQAMVEWSHGLLDPADQRLFRRLAVFPASFTLDAAVAVEGGKDRWEILDSLGRLVDKSLVTIESREPVRYRLLETLRIYAAERLRSSGESDEVSAWHARQVLAVLEEAYAAWETVPTQAWRARYRVEMDDLRAALDWALAVPGRRRLALELAGPGARLFTMLELNADGKRYLDRIIPLIAPDTPAEVAARVLSQAAGMLVRTRDPARLLYAQRAAELYRQLGDPVGLGTVLAGIGQYRVAQQRHAEALTVLEEAWELLGNTTSWKRQLVVLGSLGWIADVSGEHDAAGRYFRQALDLSVAWGDEPIHVGNLAGHEFFVGNVGRAIEIGREAIERLRGPPYRKGIRYLMVNQAHFLLHVGDVEEARSFAAAAFADGRKTNYPERHEVLLWAVLSAFEGRLIEAARLLGVVDAEQERLGAPVGLMERPLYEELGRRLDAGLPPAELEALKAEGARWTVAQAMEFVSTCLLLPPRAS